MDFKGLAQEIERIKNLPLKVRTVCPICAESLSVNSKGEVRCLFCGWPKGQEI